MRQMCGAPLAFAQRDGTIRPIGGGIKRLCEGTYFKEDYGISPLWRRRHLCGALSNPQVGASGGSARTSSLGKPTKALLRGGGGTSVGHPPP
jgi:hypothetical protein